MAKHKPTVLIVDDEPAHRLMIKLHLGQAGYNCLEAEHGQAALAAVGREAVDLVLLDVRMPVLDGEQTLKLLKEDYPDLPVIMMTAYGSIEDAVKALKAGASDYLTKPLDTEEMIIKVGHALEVADLKAVNRQQAERLGQRFDFGGLIGQSPVMVSLVDDLRLIAPSEATVLILGQSGTGKEVAANVIHHNSGRAKKPFIKVNCAALPDNLLEAELFGHEAGAFTDAKGRRLGRFLSADQGTIFLDEIGTLAPTTQAKLLRVLQEREIQPLGSDETIQVDVRVLAATNSDLQDQVQAGTFREDLYYRLNVVSVEMPPLKDRGEDIILLADHFLKAANEKNKRQVNGFDEETVRLLMGYSWPGNVRELSNIVERAVVLCPGETVSPNLLPAPIRGEAESGWFKPGASLKEAEQALISWTLTQTSGNRTQAARQLGVTRKTLQNKIKEYGLETVGLEK